ncbi:MAG: hypothetical protein ABSF44_09580 [Candidatus Bathyarchaeia archaeon]
MNFNGQIVLSLIMKDGLIANLKPTNYATAINSLHPDSFTTVDGETYDGEFLVSSQELKRIHRENEELLSLVPNVKPIGLVKGCSETQVVNHLKQLKSYGIDEFVFHISDFFRNGNRSMIRQARTLSLAIRKNAEKLILYGFSSQKRLQEYSFADRFVTSAHFVAALNGWKFVGTKQTKYTGGYNAQVITENFAQLCNNIKNLRLQKTLLEGN